MATNSRGPGGAVDGLTPDLLDRVRRDFLPTEHEEAGRLLLGYELDQSDDPEGVARVRHAMLTGARGDLYELRILLEAARKDYRDVLYWTGC
jgi:hypothetical protein